MDFKNLPFWGQVTMLAVACAALACVAYWAYPNFSQMQQQNLADAKRLEDLQTEIRRGAAIEAKLPEFEKEIANLQKKLKTFSRSFPRSPRRASC